MSGKDERSKVQMSSSPGKAASSRSLCGFVPTSLSLCRILVRRRRREGGHSMVRGVRFLVDDTGRKTAVQIDLKRQARLWEDFYARALAEARASEPPHPP